MSGYFSQLAHHTGLDGKIGSGLAAEPSITVRGPESAAPQLMHVEEISFTAAPAPDAAQASNEGPTTFPVGDRVAAHTTDVRSREHEEPKDDAHFHGVEATERRASDPSQGAFREASTIAFTGSVPPTRTSRELSGVEYLPASNPVRAPHDEPSAADRRSQPAESIAIPYDSIEIVESHSVARDLQARNREAPRPGAKDPGQADARGNREAGGASRDRQAERESIVGNYLKEVTAWVSAPPELDRQDLESQRDAQRLPAPHRAERPLASHDDVVDLGREIQPAGGRAGRSETLDVQELNLSIGTISIVIEEPKQVAPTPHQPPVRVDSSRERPMSEPTRLSRYYMGRW
jgi:hypothetical protein